MTSLIPFLFGAFLMLSLLWARNRFAAFAAQRPGDYTQGEAFDIRRHLNGPMTCDGVIYGPLGRVASRFTADFDARWQGNRGVMAEQFLYDSGARQDREWRLEIANDGTLRADADDLVGTGVGRQEGSALHLRYRIRLTEDAGGHVLDVTDWMYLAPGGAIVNRSQFRKFGIKVAELVAVIRRKDAA